MNTGGEASFLRIADITIGVSYAQPSLWRALPETVSRFAISNDSPADIELRVETFVEPLPEPGELLFDSGGVWRLYERDGEYRLDCHSELLGEQPYKIGLFDSTFTRGRILVRPDAMSGSMHPLDYPFDEVLLANLLARGRGVELHGCGLIDDDGRGHLFVGQSGAGKTTTARIWEHVAGAGIQIVSDDRVIVREVGGEMRIYGTPWHGEAEHASPASAPLAGVYLLEQAPLTELVPMSDASAVASLFGCTFPLFWDGGALSYTLEMLNRMAQRVPVRTLRFTPDASAVEAVRRAA
jgi:hypothetical protein